MDLKEFERTARAAIYIGGAATVLAAVVVEAVPVSPRWANLAWLGITTTLAVSAGVVSAVVSARKGRD